jgi:ABC-type transport system involved in multi-copper enzyme maturation permease subunit
LIATIARKEWKEHRTRYLIYWLVLNAPILFAALAATLSAEARLPFAGLSDTTLLQHLPLSLIEALAVPTIFLLVTASLAVPMFNREAERGAEFLLHEQPISRGQYAMAKLAVGGLLVVISVTFAILFAVTLAWVLMLASEKVSWAGSVGHFGLVFAAAARSSVWASLISLGIYAGSALVAALSPRWWIATLGAVVFAAAMLWWFGDYFDFTPDNISPESLSISVNHNFGGPSSKPWIAMNRALLASEVQAFAPWKPLPLLIAAAATGLFASLLRLLYQRGDVP